MLSAFSEENQIPNAKHPSLPGVYEVFDAKGVRIYVGKAKNLRRRLSQYRNARRIKKHKKMRQIVKEAARLHLTVCESDLEACLLEQKLIALHRPKHNIAGAYSFLYPMIGLAQVEGHMILCRTTSPEKYPEFRFHGAYRSRLWTGRAFEALEDLTRYLGHPAPRKLLFGKNGLSRRSKYSRVFGIRGVPLEWFNDLELFLKGESTQAIEDLVLALAENRAARRKPDLIQEFFNDLKRFWKWEAKPLAQALKRFPETSYPVAQEARDFLFIKNRHKSVEIKSVRKLKAQDLRLKGVDHSL